MKYLTQLWLMYNIFDNYSAAQMCYAKYSTRNSFLDVLQYSVIALSQAELPVRKEVRTTEGERQLLAFFEAYFSNYICDVSHRGGSPIC